MQRCLEEICLPHKLTAKFSYFLIQCFASPLEDAHNMFCLYLTGTSEHLRRARDQKVTKWKFQKINNTKLKRGEIKLTGEVKRKENNMMKA